MSDNDVSADAPLWIIEVTFVPSGAATAPVVREALRGIKARRRKGDPMTCACCPTTLGAAPFTLILARPTRDSDPIPSAESGLCRRCAPDLAAAEGRVVQAVRGIWPALAGYKVVQL